ncbi:YybH family protein [Azovibrio restrictus]|uniref:YybH family protein n=1 Tax=Azovibrio restrictus TaxID=146938 RepID=UPI0004028406|nr:nuclear transport factor 2 family protein [Azovibrio restrictus]MCE1171912.1 nuclear transport factor 2 family protein [Azovibrio sp.]
MNPPAPPLFATPEDAESAFYDAIARGDLEALMAVWSEDEEVICTHPTGQQLQGLAAIRESWRQVLATTRLQINGNRIAQWQGMLLSVHQIVEHLQVGEEITGPLQATNVFTRGPHGWRLVCRHSSAAAEPTVSEGEHRVLH